MPARSPDEVVDEEEFESALQEVIGSAIANDVSIVGHWIYEGDTFDLQIEITTVDKEGTGIPGDFATEDDS